MNKTSRLAALLILPVLALSACGTTDGAEDGTVRNPATSYTFWQEIPNGGKVLCVWAKSGYGGGLSCDWKGAKR